MKRVWMVMVLLTSAVAVMATSAVERKQLLNQGWMFVENITQSPVGGFLEGLRRTGHAGD